MTLYFDIVKKHIILDIAGGEENNAAGQYREEKC